MNHKVVRPPKVLEARLNLDLGDFVVNRASVRFYVRIILILNIFN